MIRLALLIGLIAAICIGCTPKGDTNYYYTTNYFPEDTTGTSQPDSAVRILSPAAGEMMEVHYDWLQSSGSSGLCGWAYRVDTVISAVVAANVPYGVRSAQAYIESYSGFQGYGSPVHPSSDTFLVPIYSQYNSTLSTPDDTVRGRFMIHVIAGDSSNWVSPTTRYAIALSGPPSPQTAPIAPELDTVFYNGTNSQHYIDVRWCTSTPNNDRFLIHFQTSGETQIDTISGYGYARETGIYDFLPNSPYRVWMTAANQHGESPVSNSMDIETGPPSLFRNPVGTADQEGNVNIYWDQNDRGCDTILIDRRVMSDPVGWRHLANIGVSGYSSNHYYDSTAARATVNFYRLGEAFRNGTWWSSDSIGVWVP